MEGALLPGLPRTRGFQGVDREEKAASSQFVFACFPNKQQLHLCLRHVHRFHIIRDSVHNDRSLVLGRHQRLVGQSVLLIVLPLTPPILPHRLSVGRHLEVVRVGRRVLGGLPHHHDAEEQQEVVDAPDGLVDATPHPTRQPSQPLVLPHGARVVIDHDVAEADQRGGGQHDAHHQQRTQLAEDLQLRHLLLLRQLLHRVHQALEDPEVRQRVQPTRQRRAPRPPRGDEQANDFHGLVGRGVGGAEGVPERHQEVAHAEADKLAGLGSQRRAAHAQSMCERAEGRSPHADDEGENARERARGGVEKDGEEAEEEDVVARVVEHRQVQHLHRVVDDEAHQHGLG